MEKCDNRLVEAEGACQDLACDHYQDVVLAEGGCQEVELTGDLVEDDRWDGQQRHARATTHTCRLRGNGSKNV